jgi:TolA-binding protein
MIERDKYTYRNPEQPGKDTWSDADVLLFPEDSVLFGRIRDYMRGSDDIADVKSDPHYSEIMETSGKIVAGFNRDSAQHKPYAKFIRESLSEKNGEDSLEDEINKIRMESSIKDASIVTAEWVKEWHEKCQKNTNSDERSRERKDYILNALAETDVETSGRTADRKNGGRSLFLRYAIPAAAAIIGALILIKSLLPSNDPDRLFEEYFEPPGAISPVTRSADAGASDSYASAIENYNNHNYQAAALGFSNVIQQDALSIPPRFFMGISQMALGNYNQAVNILEDVVNRQGEYLKEARWYLGLAYIKTGNPEKASGCFEILAGSPGYYSDRARNILRSLR